MDTILTFESLQTGMWYKLVSNSGYFCKTARYIGQAGEQATFREENGRIHYVSMASIWNSDNPVVISPA